MSASVDQLIPYLREISFCFGLATGLVVSLLCAIFWRS